MTVSKSYVYEKIKRHRYQIQMLRRAMKHRRPKTLSKNLCWGVDLTTVTDDQGRQHQILAMIDYGTRRCLCLQAINDKRPITLLKYLIQACFRFGKPKSIKTDNEAVFTSALFESGLRLLSIRHQKSEIACPWQNGRVERFIGTFKASVKQLQIVSFEQLTIALPEFQFYYNIIRPHQYL
ncbi:MAG: integrase core domain-containing protein, partial [Desulfobacterales bacterium]